MGKGFLSTAIGQESLGTKANVSSALVERGNCRPLAVACQSALLGDSRLTQLAEGKAGLTFLQLTTGNFLNGNVFCEDKAGDGVQRVPEEFSFLLNGWPSIQYASSGDMEGLPAKPRS